jgi:hypothetical protein
MLAAGGDAIADLAVLRNQPEMFGSVASDDSSDTITADSKSANMGSQTALKAALRHPDRVYERCTPGARNADQGPGSVVATQHGGEGGPVRGAELRARPVEVALDGADRHDQPVGDVLIGQT